mmetsp:Transcript_59032/g.133699  ORF Transcript_59032/g.133699 Transcript_59032/m.133699 type:complete len:147 (+) Transcript_59032:51-491(+)|eukprot:CAMPEP_0172617542 /NCGR_PEP_ID=MMETSP1068-20121228/70315_1 /TAXON_ID=35684 /ORGANISM="Pseudopedinella elastica, Strain CCMP716" /LENGTH=146 /DNA_ID=CAMNT_0013423317 /DNA_START=50 /DNA_END=490 /DNA_ORIENTATION=-
MKASAMVVVLAARSAVGFSAPRALPGNRLGFTRLFSSDYRGPMQERIEAQLASSFPVQHLDVLNESHGKVEDESHFKVVLVSEAFEGKNLVARHRLVNGALADPSTGALPFHSLTIVAKTPEQWDKDTTVPASPQCAGGDGSGLKR